MTRSTLPCGGGSFTVRFFSPRCCVSIFPLLSPQPDDVHLSQTLSRPVATLAIAALASPRP